MFDPNKFHHNEIMFFYALYEGGYLYALLFLSKLMGRERGGAMNEWHERIVYEKRVM